MERVIVNRIVKINGGVGVKQEKENVLEYFY